MTPDYKQIITKIFAIGLFLLGLYYFIEFIYLIVNGKLDTGVISTTSSGNNESLYAVLLTIPLPVHLMTVGLYLQRNLFTLNNARLIKILVIGSGLWLGLAYIIKNFSLFN